MSIKKTSAALWRICGERLFVSMQSCSCHACAFHLLGVSMGATEKEVLRAWRRKLVLHHPDKSEDVDGLAAALNQAKERALLSLETFDCMLARSYRLSGRLEELASHAERLRSSCRSGHGARRMCLRELDPDAFTRARRPRGARRMRWPGVVS